MGSSSYDCTCWIVLGFLRYEMKDGRSVMLFLTFFVFPSIFYYLVLHCGNVVLPGEVGHVTPKAKR
jgi:hypothetical protein